MIKGIGIDTVTISEIGRFLDSETIARKVFTARENETAKLEDDPADYYSRCFATKEAAFKALDHLMGGDIFDFTMVETLHHKDGAPYINPSDELKSLLKKIGVDELLVSCTTEGDFCTAIVVAQGK